MFTFQLTPRYSETDALGHITNTALPVWFEEARAPIFEIFMPGLGLEDWNLILKKLEVEFHRELFHGSQVEVRTWVAHLGKTSLTVAQEAWQKGALAASGRTTLIHFDFRARKPAPIPQDVRRRLEAEAGPEEPAGGRSRHRPRPRGAGPTR